VCPGPHGSAGTNGPLVPFALGRQRPAWRGQSNHAREDSGSEEPHYTRNRLPGGASLRGRNADVWHPALQLANTAGLKIAGTNQAIYHDDLVSGELGQIGTQFDGLGHLGIGDLFYNGNNRADFAQAEGLTKLGIENVGPLFTRGVLLDVARYKGVAQLQPSYEITAADLRGTLQRQNLEIRAGDVVLVHTGWGALWMKDNAKYSQSSPGIGVAAAQFLVDAEVSVVGADNWGVEVMPNPNASLGAPVHQLLLARNGIYLHENLNTADLARDSVYEFAYIFVPLPLKGATGSPGNPIAVR
jgi:kynurenine formamidase